jgi:hypothetical protein
MSKGLAAMYRMPVSFGPAPGPRNLPEEHRHRRYDKTVTSLTLSAETDAEKLARLLPPGFAVDGPPRIEIVLTVLKDVGWLAGRGYNIVLVRIPARYRGEEETDGLFVPVVWESMADPILTGREELGWPKIYADIPDPEISAGRWATRASWQRFTFLEMAAEDFQAADAPASSARPMMFHKYIPRTGQWGEGEVDYFTIIAPEGPPPRIRSTLQGSGTFTFNAARWEDMPTQFPIVNALAALPLADFGPAVLVEASGGGDASGQRRLR